MVLKRHSKELYLRKSILVVSCLPQTQSIHRKYLVYCSYLKELHFLAMCRVGLMTHGKCRIDRPFVYHVTRSWVRTEPHPPTI